MFAVGATPVTAVVPAKLGRSKTNSLRRAARPASSSTWSPSDAVHFQQVNLPPVFPRSRRRRRAMLARTVPKAHAASLFQKP